MIINHKTWMMHKAAPDDLTRTICPHVKDTSLSHYEHTLQNPDSLRLYTRCGACWIAKDDTRERCHFPKWDEPSSEGGEGVSSDDSTSSSTTTEPDPDSEH